MQKDQNVGKYAILQSLGNDCELNGMLTTIHAPCYDVGPAIKFYIVQICDVKINMEEIREKYPYDFYVMPECCLSILEPSNLF